MASAVLEPLNQSHMMSDTSSSANADFLEDLFGQIDDQPSSSAVSRPVPDDEILAFLHAGKRSPEPLANVSSVETSSDADGGTSQDLVPDEPPVEDKQNTPDSPPKAGDERSESLTEEVVFKRPLSPQVEPSIPQPTAEDEPSGAPVPPPVIPSSRVRRDVRFGHRLEPHPAQRCFLTGIKRKRPPTESGELMNLVKMLKEGGKLLFPDILLADYLEEAGVEGRDSKVARLMGAAAEHHSACIVQDAMQLYTDSHHERRKHGREKEHSATSDSGKTERPVVKPKPSKIGRPLSAGSKGSGKTGKRKGKHLNENLNDSGMDTDIERDASALVLTGNPEGSLPDGSVSDPPEGEEEVTEKATTKSVVSKDERESGGTKGKKEKEVEKRNVLTLEVLSPVLRDHGYHVGRPPYLVN